MFYERVAGIREGIARKTGTGVVRITPGKGFTLEDVENAITMHVAGVEEDRGNKLKKTVIGKIASERNALKITFSVKQ
ncbi:MAG: hypothetical protein V1834_00530 [Candidatus Micrarchaeota archaeon]